MRVVHREMGHPMTTTTRRRKEIDWQAVICNECRGTFNYENGVRAPWPGLAGVSMVLCSQECAEAWLGEVVT